MVHPHYCVRTAETVLFHGVDNSVDDADKHLTHLSQGVDWHLTQRSKWNKQVVGNKDNDVDDGVDNDIDNDVGNGVDNSDDGANKHLPHLSQGVDCHLTLRSKQNKH
eukprot:6767133-Ditylum_brightwellii.AAC.1